MSESFEITNGQGRGRAVLLRISGRLDAKSTPLLLQRCMAIRANNQNLVLNLSGVTFIASSGVGALLGLVEEFRQVNAHVRFACLSSPVDSVIRLLNLHQFLDLHGTENEALAALEV